MPDDVFGDPVPPAQRTSRKRQLADHEQRSIAKRTKDCIDYPLLYEMAEALNSSCRTGRPHDYPPIAYLITATLMPVTESKRSAIGSLHDEQTWRRVRTNIRQHYGRITASRLPAHTHPVPLCRTHPPRTELRPPPRALQELRRSPGPPARPLPHQRPPELGPPTAPATPRRRRDRPQSPLQSRTPHRPGPRYRRDAPPTRRPRSPYLLRKRRRTKEGRARNQMVLRLRPRRRLLASRHHGLQPRRRRGIRTRSRRRSPQLHPAQQITLRLHGRHLRRRIPGSPP